jgi:hypothetical protein
MKIVYVITSAGGDAYTAMTRISAASLRMTNPSANICVVCDAETNRAVREAHDPLLDEVDEWLTFETPPGDAAFRNRYLKTSLRQRVSGEYLFLDSDTIVRDDLSEIFQLDGDIAAAPNHSRDNYSGQIWSGDRYILKQMNWTFSGDFYLNGGVMWVSESKGARWFYQLWHERWIDSHRHLHECGQIASSIAIPDGYIQVCSSSDIRSKDLIGASRDQPSLHAALFESKAKCARMACRFNAQIGSNPLSMRDAAIWHYYYSLSYQSHSYIGGLIQNTIQSQNLDTERIMKLMESQNLWPKKYWISGPGIHMVNGAVREIIQYVETGQDIGEFIQSMQQTNLFFARKVLAKAVADSYWSSKPVVYRFLMRRLIRACPLEILNEPVRHCFVHDAYRRFKKKSF